MTEIPAPKPSQVELLEKLCKKLHLKGNYRPDLFSNPSLASFYSKLETLVYEEEDQEFEDATVPQAELHDQRIQKFLDDIDETFGTVSAYSVLVVPIWYLVLVLLCVPALETTNTIFFGSQDPLAGSSTGKRANGGDTVGGGRAKASKKDLSQNDIEQAIRNGRVK